MKKKNSPLPAGIARGIEKRELLAKIPLSYPTIWKRMREGLFPRSRVIGGRTIWLESEIDAWLAALPNRPLKGDDETAAA
jgi:predicted DNA-binding transcriptional regulator AlpA